MDNILRHRAFPNIWHNLRYTLARTQRKLNMNKGHVYITNVYKCSGNWHPGRILSQGLPAQKFQNVDAIFSVKGLSCLSQCAFVNPISKQKGVHSSWFPLLTSSFPRSFMLNLRDVVWCRDPCLSHQCQYPPQCHHQRPTGSPCHQQVFVEWCVGSTAVPVLGIYLWPCWSTPEPVKPVLTGVFFFARKLSNTTAHLGVNPWTRFESGQVKLYINWGIWEPCWIF